MSFLEKGIGLEDALQAFDFGGQVAGALRFGEGHINDTFAAYTQQQDTTCKRFILQRINTRIFTDPAGLMENIVGVTSYLRKEIEESGGDPDRETLTVLATKEGKEYYTSPENHVWRAYLFVEDAVCYQTAESPELFAASARAFGNFTRLLEGYPAHTLHETIAKFHDTRVRFQNFKKALEADSQGRAKDCPAEIDFVLAREKDCAVLMDLLDAGQLPLRVTHNDTKLNNVLMDPVKVEGVCVIDLDTVMPGLSLHDFGDSIRFGASTAAEDEPDLSKVSFSLPLYETYTAAYLEVAGGAMTDKEKEMMPWGAKLMTLECGMRFLTDYLEGDHYFRTHREGHNLDRCRTQLKLVADMEQCWSQMEAVVQKYI